MNVTPRVKEILSWYESENPGVKTNLARLLMHGRLAGTGKLVILPVDQGFEHGPAHCFDMQEELREISREAKAAGLMTVVWSYPRGGNVSKAGESALDITAYAAHMAALMGATIIKVKPPKPGVDLEAAKATYEKAKIPQDTLSQRVGHIMQAAFNGKRVVVFSGGEAKGDDAIIDEVKSINGGGGFGSIMGRNAFQRSRADALALLDKVVGVYKGK
ncbi:MAG: hypothetical protein IPL47_16450 [Phyllobacteriaceae bacterium]|nr:hypothetical protein [Phyllobacteriaceae bacterium]